MGLCWFSRRPESARVIVRLTLAALDELSHKKVIEGVTKLIAESSHGHLELVLVYVTGLVLVEGEEALSPIFDVLPQLLKLVVVQLVLVALVEHGHH